MLCCAGSCCGQVVAVVLRLPTPSCSLPPGATWRSTVLRMFACFLAVTAHAPIVEAAAVASFDSCSFGTCACLPVFTAARLAHCSPTTHSPLFCRSKLAADFLCHPVKVTIGSQDLAASHSVTQVGGRAASCWSGNLVGVLIGLNLCRCLGSHPHERSRPTPPTRRPHPVAPSQVVEVVEDRARDGRLHELLQQYHSSRTNRVIIFVLYKKEAVRVEQHLTRKGWKVRGWVGRLVGGSCIARDRHEARVTCAAGPLG